MLDMSAASTPRIALVTCATLADLVPDDRLLLDPLASLGATVEAVVWDDLAVKWDSYDLVVLRSPWDYPLRRDEFVAWAATVSRLMNPVDIVAWNTDKRYLTELAAAGVPVVPTSWIAPDDAVDLPVDGEWVIKPAVSAGSRDTGRYDLTDPAHRELAQSHVTRLQQVGRLVMVQPYLQAVDSIGETALIFFRGEYSHAIRKAPMLTGPDLGEELIFVPETILTRTPTPAEFAVAAQTLAAVPGGARRLLYARVDLIPGPTGEPVVVELELTEPSVFLSTSPDAPERLAAQIMSLVSSPLPNG